jgi:hypothetical protein
VTKERGKISGCNDRENGRKENIDNKGRCKNRNVREKGDIILNYINCTMGQIWLNT